MSTKVELQDPSETPATRTVEIRGKRFTFRELEIGEYDKLVKQASHPEVDADGITQDVTDNTLLLRLMVLKSCVTPKLTDASLAAFGYRFYRTIARIVNDLHYGDEPVKEISGEEDTPSEESPKGNA
jgi:hypothetical protein